MKKIYLIAGEPSGDLHGAHLVEALKRLDPDISFRGFGGQQMERAGVELDQTIDQLSFMGFTEVLKHLPVIVANFRKAKNAIRTWNPDAIVYIDFPGFNLRMAAWSRKLGFRNFYYIAPQVWAWKEKRALKIRRDIDELFCILPFEKEFFARFDYDVNYVGHPLVDIIRQYKAGYPHQPQPDIQVRNLTESVEDQPGEAQESEKEVLALLPGSRAQEVSKILPVQLQAVKNFNQFRIVIGKSPHVPASLYDGIIDQLKMPNAIEIEENSYDLLSKAYIACVASGTATLETALFHVPEVVCFRGTKLNYLIAKRLIKVPYISLVNLVMGREVVRELIQHELNPDQLRKELLRLSEKTEREMILNNYQLLENNLGMGGAAEKTAKIIIYKIRV